VLIGAPEEALYASARSLLMWGLLGVALLIALMGGMAWWIGRSVVEGVEVLCRDAEMIGRGERPPEPVRGLQELDFVGGALRRTASVVQERTRTLEILNRVNTTLLAEHDLQKIVQSVTDAGREASGAAFGAFFYNVENAAGESYMLYTLSGAPREAFEKFGMPRNTPVFGPTFAGEGVVRVADIRADPRYGTMAPHHGMPKGHLPVRSYLAVPVKSRDGTVIGGLFYGHPEPGVFTAEAEAIIVGLAAEAAIAIDNAKLYRALESELTAKSKAEQELRLAQHTLQQHAADLERTVEQRTTSLREAVHQMEEFSYTISHDLRSPLRSMHSFASLLLEEYSGKLDDTATEYLRRIVRASDRMHRMTSDLLQYSKVARAEVKLSSTSVAAVVQANVEHYPELKPPTVITVVPPLANVMAYEPSLVQCLGNLMTNAAKFMPAGRQPHITGRTEIRGERVRIWVEDNGIGISALGQKQLFQVFQRLPHDQPYEGTGMGLAIVRRAAEKMGGTCGVESDGVSGSRFWIELALSREQAAPTEFSALGLTEVPQPWARSKTMAG
jgi:signal transduction histidine kinase